MTRHLKLLSGLGCLLAIWGTVAFAWYNTPSKAVAAVEHPADPQSLAASQAETNLLLQKILAELVRQGNLPAVECTP